MFLLTKRVASSDGGPFCFMDERVAETVIHTVISSLADNFLIIIEDINFIFVFLSDVCEITLPL